MPHKPTRKSPRRTPGTRGQNVTNPRNPVTMAIREAGARQTARKATRKTLGRP